ncbi:MAG: DUF615 domain-containing protein, partial [Immundisolibacteraceae bacterium]|nr:DUF615 domain-containing protein [Immundisolibacteraceae bacterium]
FGIAYLLLRSSFLEQQHGDEIDEDDDQEEVISRSQIKREAIEFQQLGRQIYELPKKKRNTLPLDPLLHEAFDEADRINSSDALRRHFQHVGKLIRDLNADELKSELASLKRAAHLKGSRHDLLEQAIKGLLHEGRNASEPFLEKYPHADRQLLNQLIRNTSKAESKREEGAKETPAMKKLKQYLIRIMKL